MANDEENCDEIELEFKSGTQDDWEKTEAMVDNNNSEKISIKNEEHYFKNEQRVIIRQSTFLAIGAAGIFAAFSGVINLQSSLNFEESLGTSSLAICYATTIVLNATVVPFLLQIFGAKFLLLLSDIAFIAYTLANLYPVKHSLYPAAVILGIGEAFVWPAITMFNAQFGTQYAKHTFKGNARKKNELDVDLIELTWKQTRWFTGRFFAIFAIHQIAGNLIAYIILVFDSEKMSNNATTINNLTSINFTDITEFQCGAQDCYEYDVVQEEMGSAKNNFGVENSLLRILLFVGYGLIQILSLIFHKVFLKESHSSKNKDNSPRLSLRAIGRFQAKILRHMVSPLQILIAPLNVYSGMMMGFIFGDITRSFISCPLGVEQVGLAMALFGVTATVGSVLFQRLSASFGRNSFVGLAYVLETSVLIFCMFWHPMESKAWQIYFIIAFFGLPDAVRQAAVAATYPEYFAKNKSVAFSMLSLLTSMGFTIMFALGTSICVDTKIIILISMLTFSVTCYSIAEIYFHKVERKRFHEETK
uniref:protein unc-93 homolog A-like n=1 Tax=Styela clava TaxID=7725 RepID=UPI00193ABFA3|nr:protein unc-93 homolog A-like [Styela clava]